MRKKVLDLGKSPTERLDDTTLIAEAEYSINFSKSQRNVCFVFIIMEVTVFYFLMLQKYITSKQNILKWKIYI